MLMVDVVDCYWCLYICVQNGILFMQMNKDLLKGSFFFGMLRWFFVCLFVILIFFIGYLCCNVNFILGCIFFMFVFCFFGTVLLGTARREFLMFFMRSIYFEIYKIIWPETKEVLKMTLVIMITTILVSLILFGLDACLVRLVSFIVGFRF
ncbi:MAG: Sec translocon subunit SecE [Candidatus Westeberhardia cardiocondylae]|nr:Sec translocon subunit SecE [Candidatus Westeberhardia cardiocondylae]